MANQQFQYWLKHQKGPAESENARLERENEQLNKRIEELEQEIKKLKGKKGGDSN